MLTVFMTTLRKKLQMEQLSFPPGDGEFKKVSILGWMETDLLSFIL